MQTTAAGQALISTGAEALRPFGLHRPSALAEAVELQRQHGGAAVFAHGTTDLVAQFREGLRPEVVIALRGVHELTDIHVDEGELVVGAGVTHATSSSHASVISSVPDLAANWARIANPRVRHRATLGGNLMARRPRYELALLLGVLGGVAEVVTPAGEDHQVAVPDIWDDVRDGSLLTRVRVPQGGQLRYQRDLRPHVTVAVGQVGESAPLVAVGSATAPPWFHRVEAVSPHEAGEEVAAALPENWASGVRRATSQKILAHLVQQMSPSMLGGR